MKDALIQTEALAKNYSGKPVVRAVDIAVQAGEIVDYLGEWRGENHQFLHDSRVG